MVVTITNVRTRLISAPLHTPFVTALRSTTSADSLLVEVIDTDGRAGIGEAPQSWAITGASRAGAQACIEEVIAPRLVGRDADDLAANCRLVAGAVAGNPSTKAAVDVALHDLAARRLGVPLARLLGAKALSAPTDVTISAGEPAQLAANAKERLAEGFTVLKLKVGTDASGDLNRIRAVCEAAGPQAMIRLDANQGWTAREAVRIIDRICAEGLPIELVEQPVKRDDIDGLAYVTERSDIPIMADESVFDIRDVVELIRRRAVDLVNIKLAKCGGLSVARTMLALAQAHEVGTCVGSMMETAIGVAAAASLVAAHPTTVVSDLDAAWWLASIPPGIAYEKGTIVLADSPGLGVQQ